MKKEHNFDICKLGQDRNNCDFVCKECYGSQIKGDLHICCKCGNLVHGSASFIGNDCYCFLCDPNSGGC